jgi:hypothetical protein
MFNWWGRNDQFWKGFWEHENKPIWAIPKQESIDGSATLEFSATTDGKVIVRICDVAGKSVVKLTMTPEVAENFNKKFNSAIKMAKSVDREKK